MTPLLRRFLTRLWHILVNRLDVILAGLLIFLFLLFLAVMFLEIIETRIVQLLGVSQKSEALKFLGIGMGGILLALQALASHKRAKAMEEAAKAQAEATGEQAKANQNAEKGQRQERLKNAIEHLGHQSVSVRLGGAYELFHLAQDTEDLRQTVLDILCAHIRRTTGENEYRKKHKSKPSEEIQSLLTLLFVQEHEVFKGLHINLQGSWLNGADLNHAHLEKAVLIEAYLQEANLEGAHLQGAKFEGAHLQGAWLRVAHLQEATLEGAHLQGAWLVGAYLQGATLKEAHLQGADLEGAHLQGAWLVGAHLQGADLGKAHLQGAWLVGAHLQGATLVEAHLQGATLERAHLQGAWLVGAHLQGATLEEAHLQGATLERAQLQGVTRQGRFLLFEQQIRSQTGQDSDLSGAIFEGGLSQEDLDSLVEGLSDGEAMKLREKLTPHVGKPASHQLPEGSRAITGAYSKKETEKWIAEYKEAMSEVPKAGDS